MKTYVGMKTRGGVSVTVDGCPLEFPRLGGSFEPCPFDWGHSGQEAGALAFSLLADHLEDLGRAAQLHGVFLERVVAGLPRDEWTLTTIEIQYHLEVIEGERTDHGVK